MMRNDEFKSLEELPNMEFKGATLQIGVGNDEKPPHRPNSLSDNSSSSLFNKGADSLQVGNSDVKPSVPSEYHSASSNAPSPIKVLDNKRADTGALVPWWGEDVEDFFSNRAGLIECAIENCKKIVLSHEDGDYIGAWLLTQISSWDTEKERLVILTSLSVITIKYDFIALKLLDHERVLLEKIDTVVIGGLIYPPNSLVPRLNGFFDGVSGVVKGCVLQPLQERLASVPQDMSKANPLGCVNFEARTRNINGVRTMWNNGEPLSITKKWNPFSKIPWTTYTSHPLLYHKVTVITEDNKRNIYNVDDFTQSLVRAVEANSSRPMPCSVERRSILLENYVGLGSLIHNKNALGFFKVRGKFSF